MHDDKPSATALLIAKSQAMLAETAPWAVEPARGEYYLSFAREVLGQNWKPNKGWLKLVERASIPGIYLHYALRKLAIENMAREFLAAGSGRQLVVIAAGFDPLCALLHRDYPDAKFYELDHPATQAAKKSALEKGHMGGNVHFVELNLEAHTLEGVLQTSSFNPDAPALFIAEGITMYLDARQAERFFKQVHSCGRHEDSQFLFTYMVKTIFGGIQFEGATRIADWWLALRNEKFKWGIEEGAVADYLAGMHYRILKHLSPADLSARYLASRREKLARGENICLAKIVPG